VIITSGGFQRERPDDHIRTFSLDKMNKIPIIPDHIRGATALSADITKSSKKKKRLNAKQKEEKRRRKEEDSIKELYRPKDTHIKAISADLFAKLKDATCSYSSTSSNSAHKNKNVLQTPLPVATPLPSPSVNYIAALKSKKPVSRNIVSASFQSNIPLDFPSLSKSAEILKTHRSTHVATEDNNVPSLQETVPLYTDPSIGDRVAVESAWETDHEEETFSKPSMSTTVVVKPSKKRHSKKPIVLNLDALLKTSRQSKGASDTNSKQSNSLTGDGGNFLTGSAKSKVLVPLVRNKRSENVKLTRGNVLDASGPSFIKRGKIREKKKKPSRLKRSILASRALKNKRIAEKNCPLDSSSCSSSTDCAAVKDKVYSSLIDAGSSEAKNRDHNAGSQTMEEKLQKCIAENVVALSELTLSTKKQAIDDIVECQEGEEIRFRNIIEASVKEAEKTTNIFPPQVVEDVKKTLHSRKFRPYCDMFTTKELHGHVIALTKELYRFQDRLYHTDPVKFRTKRRLVNGLKDVLSYLSLNHAQMVIIAPDVEPNDDKGTDYERLLRTELYVNLTKIK